jgi:hypothetical protein
MGGVAHVRAGVLADQLDQIGIQTLTDRQTDSTNARSAFDTHET